jgi:hypothetical protein
MPEGLQGHQQRRSQVRELVLHARGILLIDGTADQAVLLEGTERLGQGLGSTRRPFSASYSAITTTPSFVFLSLDCTTPVLSGQLVQTTSENDRSRQAGDVNRSDKWRRFSSDKCHPGRPWWILHRAGVLMSDRASRREAIEYATLSPEHEDYLRVDRAPMSFPRRARSIRWRPD